MKNILLVGVSHDDDWCRLTGHQSEALFAERILPQIDDSSILFVEGFYRRHRRYIDSSNAGYNDRLGAISPSLVQSGKTPVLAYFDDRFSSNEEKLSAEYEDFRAIISFVVENMTLTHRSPDTLKETLALIREQRDGLFCMSRKKPAHQLRSMANRERRRNDKFDSAHIRQMTRAAQQYSRVFLVAGSAHCISIHLTTNWPIEILKDDGPQGADATLKGYFCGQIAPRIIPRL